MWGIAIRKQSKGVQYETWAFGTCREFMQIFRAFGEKLMHELRLTNMVPIGRGLGIVYEKGTPPGR